MKYDHDYINSKYSSKVFSWNEEKTFLKITLKNLKN